MRPSATWMSRYALGCSQAKRDVHGRGAGIRCSMTLHMGKGYAGCLVLADGDLPAGLDGIAMYTILAASRFYRPMRKTMEVPLAPPKAPSDRPIPPLPTGRRSMFRSAHWSLALAAAT